MADISIWYPLLALVGIACCARPDEKMGAVPVDGHGDGVVQGQSEGRAGPDRESVRCARDPALRRLPEGCPPEYADDFKGYVGNVGRALVVNAKLRGDCLLAVGRSGTTGYLPPLSAKCGRGPGRVCVLVSQESEVDAPWKFRLPTPQEDPAWHMLDVADFEEYWTKYANSHLRVAWSAEGDRCHIQFEAIGDLDEDGVTFVFVREEVIEAGEFVPGAGRQFYREENPAFRNDTGFAEEFEDWERRGRKP